jgi:hypothetical protein
METRNPEYREGKYTRKKKGKVKKREQTRREVASVVKRQAEDLAAWTRYRCNIAVTWAGGESI